MLEAESFTASAPGKVILFGEHSVVYGRLALAASIDLRATATVSVPRDPNSPFLSLEIPSLGVESQWLLSDAITAVGLHQPDLVPLSQHHTLVDPIEASAAQCSSELQEAFLDMARQQLLPDVAPSLAAGVAAFLFLHSAILGPCPVSVHVSSSLPVGAGLGSSAAFCTALSASLLATAGVLSLSRPEGTTDGGQRPLLPADLAAVNRWAFEGERILHGSPSGVDNNVSCYGGVLRFQNHKIQKHLSNPLPLQVLLTNTKVQRNTKTLVSSVATRRLRHPAAMDSIFSAMETMAEEASSFLEQQKDTENGGMERGEEGIRENNGLEEEGSGKVPRSLKELVEMSQGLLQAIGVSHEAIADICHITSGRGMASKLTGAGGGGCVLTLVPPGTSTEEVEEMKNLLQERGYECFNAVVGGPGVIVHGQQ